MGPSPIQTHGRRPMSAPKLSTEYRVRWKRSTWHPNEHATVVVLGDEEAARRAAAHIAGMYDDVSEVVLEVRQVTRWRHHDVYLLDTEPHRLPFSEQVDGTQQLANATR